MSRTVGAELFAATNLTLQLFGLQPVDMLLRSETGRPPGDIVQRRERFTRVVNVFVKHYY